jgi:hypothetical protein
VNNIKMDLREIGWDGVDWIDLAQDRDHWRAPVNAVMNLQVPKCWEVLKKLHNLQLLRKDSAPCNSLISSIVVTQENSSPFVKSKYLFT